MTIQEHNTAETTPTMSVVTDGESAPADSPIRIYVACLAAYNNGILHGAWIDAEQDGDALQWAIWDMLKTSPIDGAEEWAIHDYEGFEVRPCPSIQGCRKSQTSRPSSANMGR